jgi:hypothetical protein
VTTDETWLYHYDPETKQQTFNAVAHGNSPRPLPEKIRMQKSAGKVLASICWYQDGILLIDYLPKGQPINAEYYPSLLVQLKDIWQEKRCRKVTKGALFLHNNDLAHWALPTQKKLGFQCLDQPPYSPDPAPPDYRLFLGLKKQRKSRHFSSDTEVIAAAETWLDGRSEIFWVQ